MCFFPLPNISNRAVNIGIVANDQSFIVNWNGHLFKPLQKLFDR